jgi:RHS repeat-associated protein
VIRAELAGNADSFYFSDAQGSVTALSQLNNTPTQYEYDAWGNFQASIGEVSANAIGYTGQRHDTETGLMALGNGERYYAPGLGRFIQQDSWTGMANMAQSLNRYAYVNGNPTRYTDPSGHEGQAANPNDNLVTRNLLIGLFKGAYNIITEPFAQVHDIGLAVGVAAGWVEPQNAQFRSGLVHAQDQMMREGKSTSEVVYGSLKGLAWGFTVIGPLIEGIGGNILDYYDGRISRAEYYQRWGEIGADVGFILVAAKAGGGRAKAGAVAESRATLGGRLNGLKGRAAEFGESVRNFGREAAHNFKEALAENTREYSFGQQLAAEGGGSLGNLSIRLPNLKGTAKDFILKMQGEETGGSGGRGANNPRNAWATRTGRAYDRRFTRFWRQYEGKSIGDWEVKYVNREIKSGYQPDLVLVNHKAKQVTVHDITSQYTKAHWEKGQGYVKVLKEEFPDYHVEYTEAYWHGKEATIEALRRDGTKYFPSETMPPANEPPANE